MEPKAWELFHENSKISAFAEGLPKAELQEWIEGLDESLSFDGYPSIELPRSQRLRMSLEKAIKHRVTGRDMARKPVSLDSVATVLSLAYGYNALHDSSAFLRRPRVVPSAGGLYPLELYLFSSTVMGLATGLYYYDPIRHNLRVLTEGDQSENIANSFLQPSVVANASILIFLTAIFERSVFKYCDRGYRYVLFEAGHVAQNMNLISTALGLACINVGGFYDRQMDRTLRLDGVTQSTIYVIAIGRDNHGHRARSKSKTAKR